VTVTLNRVPAGKSRCFLKYTPEEPERQAACGGDAGDLGLVGPCVAPSGVISGSQSLAELVAIAERLEPEALADLLAVARGLSQHTIEK
jgi:hypothetical protein